VAVDLPTKLGTTKVIQDWSPREIEALLRVSDALASDLPLAEILDAIATEACYVTRANAASIVLALPGGRLSLAAAKGFSQDYHQALREHLLTNNWTLSREAVKHRQTVIVDDISKDPRLDLNDSKAWWRFAQREGLNALMSVPLIAAGRALGALTLYRSSPGSWAPADSDLMMSFAQYAAGAIHSAELIDSQRHQVDALESVVGVLREQSHEYANRLHAISGLLALREVDEAMRFVAALESLHHESRASVLEHIDHPAVAGLLLAKMTVARQRGVEIRIDRRSRLRSLPAYLSDAQAVTLVSNLIDNAVDAVAGMPPHRAAVSVRMVQRRDGIDIAVRDWGPHIDPDIEKDLFERGRTTKAGHSGVGLALVAEAVAAASGSITIQRYAKGKAFLIALPIS
jgi:signal transduction histidine kinase